MPGFDDSAWTTPTVIGAQPNSTWTGTLLPDLTRIVETVLTPVSVTDMGGGKYMVDLGRVYSGVPRIAFSGGTSGTAISMLGGFALLGSGDIDTSQNQSTTMNYYAVLNGSTFTFQAAEYLTMRYFEIYQPAHARDDRQFHVRRAPQPDERRGLVLHLAQRHAERRVGFDETHAARGRAGGVH